MAAAVSDYRVGYEYMASVLQSLFESLGISVELHETKHPSLIPGRAAEIRAGSLPLGIIGEIHPLVLNRWGLEKPVVAFEVDIKSVMGMLG